MVNLNANGRPASVNADPATPLLWALRDQLSLTGTKFGCGVVAYGTGTTHINGQPTHAYVTPISSVSTTAITASETMVYGLSAALYGKITLRNGRVEPSNFSDCPVLRIGEMPEIFLHVVPSKNAPTGIGEPGTPPIAPTAANAVAALTGKRLRKLPFELT